MKTLFDPPVNPNYCATVVKVQSLVKLPNSDKLQGIPLFGMQAITDLSTQVGDMGVVFPAETQLSDRFCWANDLFSHADLNHHKDKKGYIENNRRIRAIKLRANRSDALFLPLSCLEAFAGKRADGLKEGDCFDALFGDEICRKYERPHNPGSGLPAASKRPSRVEEKLFPQQFDITHFLRVNRNLDQDAFCYVTQKLHGCNIRIGNVPVLRSLSLRERFAQKVLRAQVKTLAYDKVYGSHHVTKDANNPNQRHYYDEDLWSVEGHKLDGLIPEGYIVYGELVGWTASGNPIQEHYTYGETVGNRHLYVYRVAFVNGQGVACDLSWPAVKQFCASIGVDHVAELWSGYIYQLDEDSLSLFLNTKFRDSGNADDLNYENAVRLSDDSPCDEGICVRIEGMQPEIYKVKSDIFVAHETKMIDDGGADLEAEEEVAVAGEM